MIFSTSLGNAVFEQPVSLPQAARHDSLVAHATSSGNIMRLTMPGRTIRNIGSVLRNPAKTVPPLACEIDLAARARWTMTYNHGREVNRSVVVKVGALLLYLNFL